MRGAWLWLFPASYLVHLAEEAWAGERFYRWFARVSGRSIPLGVWIALNVGFFTAMVVAVLQLLSGAAPLWFVPGLGTIVTINAVAHLISSRFTHSYSPGLWSGLALWMPLGIAALVVSQRALPSSMWWRGVIAGGIVHAIVAALAVLATRFRSGA